MYLDTTYAHQKHTIPDQRGPVDLVGEFVAAAMDGDARLGGEGGGLGGGGAGPRRRTLVLVATYLIGKERLLERIAQV
jgi:hypothetical protein